MARGRAVAWIGSHHNDLLDIATDNRAVLLNRAGNNHRHELRYCRRRIRAVAGLTRPRVSAGRQGVAILEALEGIWPWPTAHWVVLLGK